MKKNLLLLLLAVSQVLCAQTVEPNLKWGKPTDAELKMTEYAVDKDADAVVLFHKTDVFYNFVNGDFKVCYDVRTRLKVLKPDGKRVADKSITYYENETNRVRKEQVTGLKAVAYNLENGKVVKTKMELLSVVDYIKVGRWIEEKGGLNKKTTNQRFYKVVNNGIGEQKQSPSYEVIEINDNIKLIDWTSRFFQS